jgi:hypothetical protein
METKTFTTESSPWTARTALTALPGISLIYFDEVSQIYVFDDMSALVPCLLS